MSDLAAYFGQHHVLITGGSSGIGLAVAKQLVGLGAEVTLIARREKLLEEAKVELVKLKPNALVHTLAVDVANEAEVNRVVGAHLEKRPAKMVINNAGIALPGRFLEMEARHYREQMDVNYFGAVHLTRVAAPHLIKQGGGHIANVGSLLSVMGIYGYTAYAATKFALFGFSECLRAELKPHGVEVSILLPPDTDTPQHAAELAHLPAETKAISGNVKMMSAESVADALLRGMANKQFEIVPGMESRFTVLANRWMPGVVRWFCDSAQGKAQKSGGAAAGPAHG